MNRRAFLLTLPAVAVAVKSAKPIEEKPTGQFGFYDPEGGTLGPGSPYYGTPRFNAYISNLSVPEGW